MDFPRESRSAADVLTALEEAGRDDVRQREGRLFGLVYGVDDEHADLVARAYQMYLATNGLGAGPLWKSLGRFERELIGGALALLGNPEGAGSVTSGGSESIIMGLWAAKRARVAEGRWPERPEVVVPASAHPAFEKACALMGLTLVRTALGADTKADVAAFRAALGPHTIAAAGSAPNYPYGTVDDVPALAAAAAERDIHFHTDACVGGFALPFLERAGAVRIPAFDFRVPGVRTMSADLHKYGFAARGISLVLYRDRVLRNHATFRLGTWTAGPYVTPTLAGSRPGGVVAAAWAVMQSLGEVGYTRLHVALLETTARYRDAVRAAGFHVVGEPVMSLFAFVPDDPAVDVSAVAAGMAGRGWVVMPQATDPPSLHLLLTPRHASVVDAFAQDLQAVSTTSPCGAKPAGGVRYGDGEG